ncbi:hypothetical protein CTA1_10916 [Colletotrichum tanaceti]|uniref:Uncharacterized protein n=1 Tax=Colletotrichum tanaceti TaxID=1306861 RepID=A0A4U6XKQ5_9PEZI|nr:hypothetical protein CTA1_10916 [Colletotrichum tanaceti]
MGVDSNKPPPLPAPTETDSITPTELATDVSRPADEASHYSLPDDGTPVTIKTRNHRANRSQTSLLIEYFEGGKPGPSGTVDRKPSVRVRLTPSKKHRNDHIQITETNGNTRKTSLTRRVPLPSTTGSSHLEVETLEGEDAESMRSYASATEESNVSRNPIDIEIDRSGRRRRPASPLIPDGDAQSSYLPPNMSDISAIPQDSFLDGSGSTVLTRNSERRSKSTSRGNELAAGVAGAMAGATIADQTKSSRSKRHSGERKASGGERSSREKDRKHRSSKSRTSSISEKQSEGTRSPRRRSSRSHVDSVLSGADSSLLSSSISPSHRSYDQSSVRSGASKSSINNPKLLETVEDAIRRLILPELSALKREQSKRESRRSSLTSTGTGTSLSREDLGVDRRRSADKRSESGRDSRHRERRDREARHDYVDSPRSIAAESVEESSIVSVDDTPRRSDGALKAAVGGAAAAGLAAATLNAASPSSDDRRQRRRRRADGSTRSRSVGREKYDEEFREEEPPAPPMPLMSEINPSEMTRTSILSADTDRPHSAMEERASVQEVARGNVSMGSSPTPTQTPASNLQQTLGTKHANISHGDLRELSRSRTGDFLDHRESDDLSPSPSQQTRDEYDDDYDERSRLTESEGDYADSTNEYDYYNTQDVPPPLKYVPYQPERRGLSPIYSVSGYTEAGSETAAQRDSRLSHGSASPTKSQASHPDMRAFSPSLAPSNVMSRGFDEQSIDGRSIKSGQDYRNSQYTEGSEIETSTGQAVRGIAANPNIIHVPHGVESNVASLVDGSMLDQSVLTAGSGYDYRDSQVSYGNESNILYRPDSHVSYGKESNVSYDDQSNIQSRSRDVSPEKRSVADQREFFEQRERESSRTPTSSRQSHRSREFAGEYDLDEYGRKVASVKYRNSPSTSTRHSPTASEKAIAAGAVGAAAAALKAAKDKTKQPTVEEVDEEHNEEWVPEGVSRNKSFKQRTMEGREPANTPAHSIDRLDYEEQPKMGASAMPTFDDPMPEVGYVDDDALTNPSLVREPLGGSDHDDRGHWPGDITPRQGTPRQSDYGNYEEQDMEKRCGHGYGLAAAGAVAGAAAATAALSHSRQASGEHEDEWRRTSAERKRDTVITNPYDGASPVDHPDLLGGRGFEDYGAPYNIGSPTGHKTFDEGYISQGPVYSPNTQPAGKAIMPFGDSAAEDPFFMPQHTRHLSGLSQGMESPLYDPATGNGIDRIESKDIIALMQHLMVRDAQRSARDTEILVTLVRSAAEMRNSFDDLKKLLANTEDVIIKEVQENTDETVKNAVSGPRPYPSSLPRSIKGYSGASQNSTLDETAKKSNFFRKALKGLSTKGTNDLSRIEDMLMQLLGEVDALKAQTMRPGMVSGRPSYDNLTPEMHYEQDRGYEPEGQAGTSTTSHGSQSGMSSFAQSRGPSKLAYEPNRISTVHEDNEEEYNSQDDYRNEQGLLTPNREFQRGGSVPLGTPPQPQTAPNASVSNDNTPKTDKGKKHKRGSSSWFPKISRWSESTATSVSKAFRGSGSSKKEHDEEFLQHPPSRSGSDLRYDDRYQNDFGSDQLHSGFSQQDLAAPNPPHLENAPPATYMTPEDPKYKAHRNSVNLQHPQPRQGQTERFKAALESQAYEYDTPMSPRSADWAGSATSLHRFPQNSSHYTNGSGATGGGDYYNSPPAGPPRPPKEPMDEMTHTPAKKRISNLALKSSPLPYNSVESGYGTGPGTHAASNYTGSPKPDNRNLSGARGMPARRPSGPRAMTPKSAEEDAAREERRRKRGENTPLRPGQGIF